MYMKIKKIKARIHICIHVSIYLFCYLSILGLRDDSLQQHMLSLLPHD